MDGLDAAMANVAVDVDASGSSQDLLYFTQHRERFRRTTKRIQALVPAGAAVLDFGSHFLHQASILAQLGYTVTGLDLDQFADLDFVAERARRFGVETCVTEFQEVADGRFLQFRDDAFDAMLFCEVMEHITFNPVSFWRRVRDVVRVDGLVYITTPNALKLLSVMGAIRGLVTLSRIGISTRAIFSNVTYGHHWKEYSARELVEYFDRLSPDFELSLRTMPFTLSRQFPSDGIVNHAREALRRIGNATGVFAEQIEVVVRITGRTEWRATVPQLQ